MTLAYASSEGADLCADVPRQGDPYVQRTLLAVLAGYYGVDALRADADVVAMARSLRDGR